MTCSKCERRRRENERKAAEDLAKAEELFRAGKFNKSKLLRMRAQARRHFNRLAKQAGKALGIHGEVEDGRHERDGDGQQADPNAG